MPNMVIMMPKDENEGQHMVKTAIDYNDGPIALRYPRGNGLGVPLDETTHSIPIGTWEVIHEGTDAAILTFGTTIPMALEAAAMLEEKGISVRVVNARFIKPLDSAMLDEIFCLKMPIMTVEEGVLAGGFGSAVLEYAHDVSYSEAPIQRMGIPDVFIEHGEVSELLAEIGMTAEHLAENILSILPKKKVERGVV